VVYPTQARAPCDPGKDLPSFELESGTVCAAGKADEFEQLKGVLSAEKGAIPYATLASRLGLSDGAVRVAVHRLRRRFRNAFREEISHTLSSPEELDEEVRHLMTLFSK
jgi:RNA polymerase sigma-70 factor (ECF subfamily)